MKRELTVEQVKYVLQETKNHVAEWMHESLDMAIKALEENAKLNNQMSAAEVLEWLNENTNTKKMEDIFGTYHASNVFFKYSPQEIVDKITEYEKSKSEKEFSQDLTAAEVLEWVYELYYRPHATDYFLGYCDTEESAIETCEYYTLNENLFGCNYKKVCRRKE